MLYHYRATIESTVYCVHSLLKCGSHDLIQMSGGVRLSEIQEPSLNATVSTLVNPTNYCQSILNKDYH